MDAKWLAAKTGYELAPGTKDNVAGSPVSDGLKAAEPKASGTADPAPLVG